MDANTQLSTEAYLSNRSAGLSNPGGLSEGGEAFVTIFS